MRKRPLGWRKEPYRHSLARHGVKTRRRRDKYRVKGVQDPNQRVKIHGMKMSRWRCPECYRGLRDGVCMMHGRVGSQVDIINNPRAQETAFDIRIWQVLKDNPGITIPHLAKKIGMDEPTLKEFLNRISDKVDGNTYLDDYRRAYPLRSRGDQMGPNNNDYDYGEESIFFSQQSDKKCRICGRRGCEGGPSCEMAAEMIDLINRRD